MGNWVQPQLGAFVKNEKKKKKAVVNGAPILWLTMATGKWSAPAPIFIQQSYKCDCTPPLTMKHIRSEDRSGGRSRWVGPALTDPRYNTHSESSSFFYLLNLFILLFIHLVLACSCFLISLIPVLYRCWSPKLPNKISLYDYNDKSSVLCLMSLSSIIHFCHSPDLNLP